MEKLIAELKTNELSVTTKAMAFMSYNPSIGRVLEKSGVDKFEAMALKRTKQLKHISTIDQFDTYHDKWIQLFQQRIKTNKGTKCSYGQAQKAINVFLKLFVDWARIPGDSTSKRLIKYLHVPLDSILMSNIAQYCDEWYLETIKPCRHKGQPYSLSKIDKRTYYMWQNKFRELNPDKPILFDVLWGLKR